jgi:tetratricopeptide (TPR) repeat protein
MARMIALYREIGDLNQALSIVDELLNQNVDSPGISFQKSILLWELERFEEAEIILHDLHQRFPDSERISYLYAMGLEKSKDFESALEVYSKIPEGSSFHEQARIRVIICYRQLKEYQQAIKEIEKLLARKKTQWEWYVVAADVFSENGQHAEAVKIMHKAEPIFPEKAARTNFLLGVYYERSGKPRDCIVKMRKVLEIEPDNSSALNYLGYLYAELGEQLDEAENLLQRALKLKPDDAFYLDSLGWIYFKMKKYEIAKGYLERARKIAPQEGVIYEHLAELYYHHSKIEMAIRLLKQALANNLEDKDRVRVEKRLQQVEKAYRAKTK